MKSLTIWIPLVLLLFYSTPTVASGSSFFSFFKTSFIAFEEYIKNFLIWIGTGLKNILPQPFVAFAGLLLDGFLQCIGWVGFACSHVYYPLCLLFSASSSGMFQPEVTILISNEMKSHTLVNLNVTLTHGTDKTNAPPFIKPRQNVHVDFIGTRFFPAGTTGVLQYDIDGTNTVLAIIWSIPFFRLWPFEGNTFGFLVYDKHLSNTPDSTLTNYKPGDWHTYTFQQGQINVFGRITDNIQAKLNVIVESY